MDISALRDRPQQSVLTVTQLNQYAKTLLENAPGLSHVTVRAEISNLTVHSSGHLYFSLKDEEGQIRAVMFRASASHLSFLPKDGMKVIVSGSVTLYPKTGSYQLYVNGMQPDGIGALYLAYEQLKEKLQAEGLFDEEHKRPLPPLPKAIGIITSPTGAAVCDIIQVTGRRFPYATLYLFPSLVQGDGAEVDLIRALDYFEQSRLCDVIIIGRGGGSIEDLWAFNSEKLARRIYSMTVPVVSAVGHETDFTICDFVADLRAPTPSAAAEIVTPDTRTVLYGIADALDRCAMAMEQRIRRYEDRVFRMRHTDALRSVEGLLSGYAVQLDKLKGAATRAETDILARMQASLSVSASKIESLSPLQVLSRGYAVVESERGIVNSHQQVKKEEELRIRLCDGGVRVRVTETFGDEKTI